MLAGRERTRVKAPGWDIFVARAKSQRKPENMSVGPIRACAVFYKRGTISNNMGGVGCTAHLGVLADARIDFTDVVCLRREDHPGLVERSESGTAGAT